MDLAVVPCALVPATPCNQHHHSPRNRARRTPLTPSVLARRTPPRSRPLGMRAAPRHARHPAPDRCRQQQPPASRLLQPRASSASRTPARVPHAPVSVGVGHYALPVPLAAAPLARVGPIAKRVRARALLRHRHSSDCTRRVRAGMSTRRKRGSGAALWQRWWRWHDACVDTAGVAVAHGPLRAWAEARVGHRAAAAGDCGDRA